MCSGLTGLLVLFDNLKNRISNGDSTTLYVNRNGV